MNSARLRLRDPAARCCHRHCPHLVAVVFSRAQLETSRAMSQPNPGAAGQAPDAPQPAPATTAVVLYKAPPAWSLPSFSVGCLQVEVRCAGAPSRQLSLPTGLVPIGGAGGSSGQLLPGGRMRSPPLPAQHRCCCAPCPSPQAYLRLAKVAFAVQECAAPAASPTGQVRGQASCGRPFTPCLPPGFPRRFCLRLLARGPRVTSCALQQLQVPALDTSADLVGADAAAAHLPLPLAELAAARTMIDYLKHKVGIKRGHSL